jgi:hypothetical protein
MKRALLILVILGTSEALNFTPRNRGFNAQPTRRLQGHGDHSSSHEAAAGHGTAAETDADWAAIFDACPAWHAYAGPTCPQGPDSCARDPTDGEIVAICSETAPGTHCHQIASHEAGASDIWKEVKSNCALARAAWDPEGEAQRMTQWNHFFAWHMSEFADYYDSGGGIARCKQVSQAWAETCDAITDAACQMPGSDSIQQACCSNGVRVHRCEDADSDWRREQSTKHCAADDSQCFDAAEDDCCDACNGDHTTDAYKAMCTGAGYQGPSICGIDASGNEIPAWPYAREECSTGPDHEVGLEEDCDDNGCHMRCSSGYNAADVEEYFNEWVSDPAAMRIGEAASEGGKRVTDAVFANVRAFIINSPNAVEHARLDVTSCAAITMDPYTNGLINVQGGSAYVFNATSMSGGTISIEGSANAMVVGGSNEGTIMCTSTGSIRIAHLKNAGPVEVHGGTDIFLSNVENNHGGEVHVSDTDAVLMDVVNRGKVFVSGNSNAFAYQIKNIAGDHHDHHTRRLAGHASSGGEIIVNAGSHLVTIFRSTLGLSPSSRDLAARSLYPHTPPARSMCPRTVA